VQHHENAVIIEATARMIPRHYPHAPITEAVISLGCQSPSECTLEDLLQIHALLKMDYPKYAPQFKMQFEVDRAEPKGTISPPETTGYQWLSGDGRRIVRLALDEFAFSQLAPYDRWETLYAEAKRIWDAYELVLHPKCVNRVAVRFINRIDIPDPEGKGVDLDIYFRLAPRIPPELPQVMRTYFVRLELPLQERNGILIVTQTAVPPPLPGLVSAILDLDVIMQGIEMDTVTAWRTVEELRDQKNVAFEASITDAARELFK